MSIKKINYTVLAPEVEQEIKNKYSKQEVDTFLNEKENKSAKGIANGYASLDNNAQIPSSQIPNIQWSNITDKPISDINDIDNSVDKSHEHNNLSLLQTINQTLLDKWSNAWSHISDSIKHITASERELWNTVSNKANKSFVNDGLNNKVDKIVGKGLSTNDYTADEKNKLAAIEENANNYSHPTSSGNRHIPQGGAFGQFLKWDADGTAVWANVPGGLELGETISTAYRGDRGKIAYTHSQSTHAPVDAISKSNTIAYTPTEDYYPATKKYVDDNSGLIIP